MTIIGLVILLIGQLVSLAMYSQIDFASSRFLFSSKAETPGQILAVVPTGYYLFNADYTAYDYRIDIPGLGSSYGTSFGTDGNLMIKKGDYIDIEYLKNHPNTHRIKGMRNSFITEGSLIMWGICLVGVYFLIRGFKNTNRFIYHVKNGYITTATLAKAPKTTVIGDTRYFVLEFSFIAQDNKPITIKKEVLNADNLLDDDEEHILYDKNNPSQNYFVDRLPKKLKEYIYQELKNR
ncbi:hypothetical protein [Labilibacter marinus]|uniref:hypothetical protein n=1 Tax=Labilibacter marinus TaxID=1477105 RepID=UPI00083094A1|nr:hypothetical protein [Labilibacter marinus]